MTNLLARLFPYRDPGPTLAVQLAECRGDLLTTERRATKLAASLEAYAGHFLRASRRAEAMTTERDRLRDALAQTDAVLAQALTEKDDLTARVLYLEREAQDLERSRENLTDIADGLRNELKAAKAHKKRR